MSDTSKPAFPRPLSSLGKEASGDQSGMTLREWYAGLALQGLLSGYLASPEQYEVKWDQVGREAVCAADAMLKALEKTP